MINYGNSFLIIKKIKVQLGQFVSKKNISICYLSIIILYNSIREIRVEITNFLLALKYANYGLFCKSLTV